MKVLKWVWAKLKQFWPALIGAFLLVWGWLHKWGKKTTTKTKSKVSVTHRKRKQDETDADRIESDLDSLYDDNK